METLDEKSGMSRIPIFECISNLQVVSTNIQAVKAEWKKLGIESGNPVDADLMWYSVIRLCIANDEIEILHSLAKNNEELQVSLSLAKPALMEVRRYKEGLRLFRNKALAHFNRDGMGRYQPMEEWIAKSSSIPRSKGEQELIYNCLDMVVAILASRFGEEYRSFHQERLIRMNQAIANFDKSADLRERVYIDDIAAQINQKGIELGLSIAGHQILERHPFNDLPPPPKIK